MLTDVSVSALVASAGISSGPTAFPLLRVMMVFLISAFEGLSQRMGSSVPADEMSGVGRFSSSLVPTSGPHPHYGGLHPRCVLSTAAALRMKA